MAEVKVKAHNSTYYVNCIMDNKTDFFPMLNERLKACSRGMERFAAFFVFSEPLSKEDLIAVYQCADVNHTLVLGVSWKQSDKKDIQIVEEPLYSGQDYYYKTDILLLGSVCQDTYITCEKNIYVLGEVRGNIDLLYEDCSISAGNFRHANVRICDSAYQNMTSFSPARIYYSNMNLNMIEYKEERVWDKQLR